MGASRSYSFSARPHYALLLTVGKPTVARKLNSVLSTSSSKPLLYSGVDVDTLGCVFWIITLLWLSFWLERWQKCFSLSLGMVSPVSSLQIVACHSPKQSYLQWQNELASIAINTTDSYNDLVINHSNTTVWKILCDCYGMKVSKPGWVDITAFTNPT